MSQGEALNLMFCPQILIQTENHKNIQLKFNQFFVKMNQPWKKEEFVTFKWDFL